MSAWTQAKYAAFVPYLSLANAWFRRNGQILQLGLKFHIPRNTVVPKYKLLYMYLVGSHYVMK